MLSIEVPEESDMLSTGFNVIKTFIFVTDGLVSLSVCRWKAFQAGVIFVSNIYP